MPIPITGAGCTSASPAELTSLPRQSWTCINIRRDAITAHEYISKISEKTKWGLRYKQSHGGWIGRIPSHFITVRDQRNISRLRANSVVPFRVKKYMLRGVESGRIPTWNTLRKEFSISRKFAMWCTDNLLHIQVIPRECLPIDEALLEAGLQVLKLEKPQISARAAVEIARARQESPPPQPLVNLSMLESPTQEPAILGGARCVLYVRQSDTLPNLRVQSEAILKTLRGHRLVAVGQGRYPNGDVRKDKWFIDNGDEGIKERPNSNYLSRLIEEEHPKYILVYQRRALASDEEYEKILPFLQKHQVEILEARE